jgi:hypothetical protein
VRLQLPALCRNSFHRGGGRRQDNLLEGVLHARSAKLSALCGLPPPLKSLQLLHFGSLAHFLSPEVREIRLRRASPLPHQKSLRRLAWTTIHHLEP